MHFLSKAVEGAVKAISSLPLKVSQSDCFSCPAHSCWISSTPAFLGSFCAPLALVLLTNCTIFLAVLRVFGLRKQSKLKKSSKKKKSKTLRAIVSLSFLMGITWVFGLFLLATDHDALQYIFALLNSLQGFFVFVFFATTSRRKEGSSQQAVRRHSSDGSRSGDYRGSLPRVSQTGSTTVVSMMVDTLRRKLSTSSRENVDFAETSVSLENPSHVSSDGLRKYGSLPKHGSLSKHGSMSKQGGLSKHDSLPKHGNLSKHGSLPDYHRKTRRSAEAAKSKSISPTVKRSQSLTNDPPTRPVCNLISLPPRRRQPDRVLRSVHVMHPPRTAKPFPRSASSSFPTVPQIDTLKETNFSPESSSLESTTYAVCRIHKEPRASDESHISVQVNPMAQE